MAVTTTSAGTGPITQTTTKTPGDILMEQLLTSVVGPTANSLLDVSATSSKTGTETKDSSTSTAAQAKIDQQIAALEASLASGNTQYQDLINNIMTNAAQVFNPTQARSRQSGAYNSTTLEMLSNDAKAKATAQSAEAVLADKKAKQLALVDLIKANATTNATDKVTYDTEANVEGNKIGKGAGAVAGIGSAALIAKSLLGSEAGKSMTKTGLKALRKILDLSGDSSSLPANWFDDLSNVIGSEGDISAAYDKAISDIFGDVTETGFPEGWFDDAAMEVFGSTDAVTNWLSSGNAGAGYTAAITNALDGEWGGNDTGSTVGSVLGSYFGPIGTAVGSWLGGAVGESALDGTESYLANSGAGLLTGDADLSDVIESGFGLTDIFETDYNVVTDAVDAVGGALSTVGGWFDDIGGGCFITTAVMKAQLDEFSDDCRELTLLRRVRDEYIANLPNGPEMLAAYREFAPVYVERISKRPDAETVWKLLYDEYILEAVKHAEAGHFRKAYLVYLLMLESVQQSSFGGV